VTENIHKKKLKWVFELASESEKLRLNLLVEEPLIQGFLIKCAAGIECEWCHLMPQGIRVTPKLSEIVSNVIFVNDEEIRSLNMQYRAKDLPTDVLSFPLFESEELKSEYIQGIVNGVLYLGDIVISVDTARLQATEFGVEDVDELKRLLVHGFLHLLGFDHENVSEDEARKMRLIEQSLLTQSSLDDNDNQMSWIKTELLR
jgi:probable rRNA maturation factor